MKWQVNYALENIRKTQGVTSVDHIRGEAIKITANARPSVIAVITDIFVATTELSEQYLKEFPEMDFLCGYRKECVWEGPAIEYLEINHIGWGSAGTLTSAIIKGTARTAAHKDYFFSYRLISQDKSVKRIVREFDRVVSIKLNSGKNLRLGMIMEYEPTADAIRTFWDRFGPADIAWNINPNGEPTKNAIEAGRELGCQVMKWEELKAWLKRS